MFYFDKKHFQFKHPCNVLVTGPSGSGKTFFIRNILSKKDSFHGLNKTNIKILWAYGQWQPLLDVKISKNIKINLMDKIPTEKDLNKNKPDILILDDLMFEIHKNKDIETLFIRKGHHMGISIFFLVQNPHYYAKMMRTITLNCHYIVWMKNPRDVSQINTIAKQTGFKFLPEAYIEATKEPFGYIRIDNTPDTPEILRVISHLDKIPIIYFQKQ